MAECPTRRIVFIDQVANEVDITLEQRDGDATHVFIYFGHPKKC